MSRVLNYGSGGIRQRSFAHNSWLKAQGARGITVYHPRPDTAHFYGPVLSSGISVGALALNKFDSPHIGAAAVSLLKVAFDDAISIEIVGTDQFGQTRTETLTTTLGVEPIVTSKYAYIGLDSATVLSVTPSVGPGNISIGFSGRENVEDSPNYSPRWGQSVAKVGIPIRLKSHRAVIGIAGIQQPTDFAATGLKASAVNFDWSDGNFGLSMWSGLIGIVNTSAYQNIDAWDAATDQNYVSVISDFVDVAHSTVRLPIISSAGEWGEMVAGWMIILDPEYILHTL